jgi:archaetidylinositol phosphate synthase
MLERFRPFLKKILQPVTKRVKINPNIITATSPIIAIISAFFFGDGHLLLGGIFILLSGVFDVFDGSIARYHERTSDFGAFFDSNMDRITDAIIIIGLMLGGYATWIIGGLAIHSSLMVSYTRASAESKGISCNVGIAERATRLIILMLGAFIATLLDNSSYMNWAVILLVVLSYITVVQRIYHVWKSTNRKKGDLRR